jgi:hypothetical protein
MEERLEAAQQQAIDFRIGILVTKSAHISLSAEGYRAVSCLAARY